MDTQRPKSPTGLDKQPPTALFEDMSKYFDQKQMFDGILKSLEKDQLIEVIDEAFDQDMFAEAIWRDLRANLKGNIFSKHPAMKTLTECLDEDRVIDGILNSFDIERVFESIEDAFDTDALADDIIGVVSVTLKGNTFFKKPATGPPTADNDIATTREQPMEASITEKKTKKSASAKVKVADAKVQATTSMTVTEMRH